MVKVEDIEALDLSGSQASSSRGDVVMPEDLSRALVVAQEPQAAGEGAGALVLHGASYTPKELDMGLYDRNWTWLRQNFQDKGYPDVENALKFLPTAAKREEFLGQYYFVMRPSARKSVEGSSKGEKKSARKSAEGFKVYKSGPRAAPLWKNEWVPELEAIYRCVYGKKLWNKGKGKKRKAGQEETEDLGSEKLFVSLAMAFVLYKSFGMMHDFYAFALKHVEAEPEPRQSTYTAGETGQIIVNCQTMAATMSLYEREYYDFTQRELPGLSVQKQHLLALKKHEEKERELEEMKSQMAALEENIKTSTAYVDKYKEEVEKARKATADLQAENDRLKGRITSAEEANASPQLEATKRKQEVDMLAQIVADKELELSRAKYSQQYKNQQLQEEHQQLKEELRRAQEVAEVAKAAQKESEQALQDAIDERERQVNDLSGYAAAVHLQHEMHEADREEEARRNRQAGRDEAVTTVMARIARERDFSAGQVDYVARMVEAPRGASDVEGLSDFDDDEDSEGAPIIDMGGSQGLQRGRGVDMGEAGAPAGPRGGKGSAEGRQGQARGEAGAGPRGGRAEGRQGQAGG